jgi:hypothetical protein
MAQAVEEGAADSAALVAAIPAVGELQATGNSWNKNWKN